MIRVSLHAPLGQWFEGAPRTVRDGRPLHETDHLLQDLHERISNAGSSTTTSFKCGFRSTHQPVTTPLLEK